MRIASDYIETGVYISFSFHDLRRAALTVIDSYYNLQCVREALTLQSLLPPHHHATPRHVYRPPKSRLCRNVFRQILQDWKVQTHHNMPRLSRQIRKIQSQSCSSTADE